MNYLSSSLFLIIILIITSCDFNKNKGYSFCGGIREPLVRGVLINPLIDRFTASDYNLVDSKNNTLSNQIEQALLELKSTNQFIDIEVSITDEKGESIKKSIVGVEASLEKVISTIKSRNKGYSMENKYVALDINSKKAVGFIAEYTFSKKPIIIELKVFMENGDCDDF